MKKGVCGGQREIMIKLGSEKGSDKILGRVLRRVLRRGLLWVLQQSRFCEGF